MGIKLIRSLIGGQSSVFSIRDLGTYKFSACTDHVYCNSNGKLECNNDSLQLNVTCILFHRSVFSVPVVLCLETVLLHAVRPIWQNR